MSALRLLIAGLLAPLASAQTAPPGTAGEPVHYAGGVLIDYSAHDGRLCPAIGVENIQIVRANRSEPGWQGGQGWTFNHQPMIAYWNGTFYVQYWSNAIGEHVPPNGTFLTTSADGRTWGKPEMIFPQWTLPDGTVSLTHQRMGFYVAPNGRLLLSAFHGRTPDPFGKDGIGRVVREAYKDGSFGPIYFIRYNRHAGWDESNTGYPFYTSSTDVGFVVACEALLANRLVTLQWWQEDQSPDDFYAVKGNLQALSFFHRKDGAVVALWKNALSALSFDEGKSWTPPVQSATIVTGPAKVWGQRTKDGRYALVYNPINDAYHRYPLAIVTGEDGILFDRLLVVNGEVPPRRYFGSHKDLGPQYTRGIVEGNGDPPGNDMWITYSMNKEDIWVARIPLPVRYKADGPVEDRFDGCQPGGAILNWNTYSTQWAPVRVAAFPSEANRSLLFEDRDPYDYAKAVRVFPAADAVRVRWRLFMKRADAGQLEAEVESATGERPVRLTFDSRGSISAVDGTESVNLGACAADRWHTVDLEASRKTRRYRLSLDGKALVVAGAFAAPALTLERLVFRTGPYRTGPSRAFIPLIGHDLPAADKPVAQAAFYIDDVTIR